MSPVAAPVTLRSDGHELSAVLHEPEVIRGSAVMAHPHPGHGGDMDHPVVVLAAERLASAGLLTLCFDFRGVRKSEGDVSDPLGHQADVRAACGWVRERAPGGVLLAGGFSYGARMVAAVALPDAVGRPPIGGLLLLAPATKVPRSPRDFGNLLLERPLKTASPDAEAIAALGRITVRTRVLVGDRDVVAPVEEVADALSPTAALEVLPGLNHFFSRGQGASATATDVLEPALDKAIQALLRR